MAGTLAEYEPGELCDDYPVSRLPLLEESVRFDLGRLAVVGPLRAAVVATAITAGALVLGDTRVMVPLVLGALFVGLADPRDCAPRRLHAMGVAVVSFSAATITGGLASQNPVVHVLIGVVVAAVCAHVGVLGPRAAMLGVISLVLFLLFSGLPTTPLAALRDGAMMLLGGAIQMAVVALLAVVGGRDSGPRVGVAEAYRLLAASAAAGGTTDATLAGTFTSAGEVAARTVAGEDTAAWLEDLVANGHDARLGLVALIHGPSPGGVSGQPGGSPQSVAAAAAVARQVARALVLPWRRRPLPELVDRLDATYVQDRAAGWDQGALEMVVLSIRSAGQAVAGPWPVTKRAWRRAGHAIQRMSLRAGVARLAPQPVFVNHAVRLSVAIAIGITISEVTDLPHGYWLPLTVAWVARPDLGGTVSRVTLRVVGTLAGAVAVAAVFRLSDPGIPGDAALVGIGSFLAIAFFTVNYATTVFGITTIVIAIFASLGQPADEDLLLRVVATVAGGVLVAAVALVRPQRSGLATAGLIVDATSRLEAYASAVLSGDRSGAAALRGETEASVARAHGALATTRFEPGHHPLPPETGQAVLEGLMATTAALYVAGETSHRRAGTGDGVDHPGAGGGPDDGTLVDLRALRQRLDAINAGVPPPPWTPGRPDGGNSSGTLVAAHCAIDALGGEPVPQN